MKNLFKKMMLVAVAAMAFVACSQDNDEINATVKKTGVVFNLSIEDVTRAYFGEEQGSGSDTSFPSYWSGNESVTLVAYDADDVVVSTAYGSIEAEGEQATQARVAATFNDDLTGVAKVRAYVGSWGYDEPRVPELSQEQYMEKEGTVASNAHTMSAEAAWDGVAQSIDLNFSHAVAYGRMQIKDLNDVTITKAIVKVDEAEYQIKLSSELDTKYIWFACDADEAIATLDIEVKASNGRSYVKTINMAEKANPLKFRTGEVSKFAVSGLVEKPADYTLDLNKVVARTGNTITFQGDEEDDKWTVIFNEGLTEIAEGVYQGVHGAAWSNESALEYDYYNSNFNLAANPYQYGYYPDNGSAINVSVEDGIYTITAFWTAYIGAEGKTVQISYVGDLTVNVPTFSTAVKTNTDNDKYVTFTGDAGELFLNFYICNYDNWIDAGVYEIVYNGQGEGQIYGRDDTAQWGYYSADGATKQAICYGTVTVSVVNGEYHFVFENIGLNADNIYLPYAEFTGAIDGLIVPDYRTQLATPSNVTSSVNGKIITLSWTAVEGADGYRVKLYSPYEEYFEEIATTNEYVYEAQSYSKQYSFTIMSYASETNAQCRSSEDAYAYVTTGKDPNVWADVIATDIAWDSTNGAFKMTGEVVSGTAWGHSSDYVRIYMNVSDRPGNNSIKVGQYTGCGGTAPQQGQFGARLSLYWGNVTYPSAIGSASTLDVTYDEVAGYTIVLTHNNVTYGYKGMPTGWVAPSEGGESGGDTGGGDDTGDEGQTYSTVFTSCKCVSNMDMGEGWGAKFELSNDEGLFLWLWVIQTSVNQSTGAIATGVYNFHNEWCDMATQPGFVVKKMRLPGHGYDEFGIIDAAFESTLTGTTNDLRFEVTFEDNSIATYTFNGTVERAF